MRTYSGEKLCAKCFCKSIEDKVRSTINKYDMFKSYDKIMVAVSGGKDSTTLLHILDKIEKNFSKASLCAVTIDEGIHGYRDEALKFASENCRKLGVEHIITSFKDLYGIKLDELVQKIRERKEGGLTPCAYCGVLRRRALNLAARKVRADKLATAHNLDDETQTILLNLIHGDASRIARVKPLLTDTHSKFVQRVKPLTEVLEREIAFYAYLKKIEFQSVPCPHASTALRNDIRAMLNRLEEKHVGTKFTLLKAVNRIRPAIENMIKATNFRSCKMCGEPTINEICKSCKMLLELGIYTQD
jgi:uncharacterized protein (TIGR00269 family)